MKKVRMMCLLLIVSMMLTSIPVFATGEVEKPATGITETEKPETNEETDKTETVDKDVATDKEEVKPQIFRVSGANRYETPMKITKNFFEICDSVVVASGEGFADALFGGALAAQLKAPMLLTMKDKLPEGFLENLKEIHTTHVYLLGGLNTVSAEVEKELKDAGYLVERIAGENRELTADKISWKVSLLRGIQTGIDKSLVVNGYEFADALSATPFVYRLWETKGFRYFGMKGLDGAYVIGGKNSVPEFADETRIAGKDRYDTAVEVAKAYKTMLGSDLKSVVIVDGTRYPDALAAGPIAANNNGAILLTQPDALHSGAADFIKELKPKFIYIIGGENSVSAKVESELKALVEAE